MLAYQSKFWYTSYRLVKLNQIYGPPLHKFYQPSQNPTFLAAGECGETMQTMLIMPMDVMERELSIPAFGAPAQLKSMPSVSGLGGGGRDVYMDAPAGVLTNINNFIFITPLLLINLLLVACGFIAFLFVKFRKRITGIRKLQQ